MLLWKPSRERIQQANLTSFLDYVYRRFSVGATDYAELYQWSIDHPEQFWPAVWEFSEIICSRKWQEVVDDVDKMPGARWFSGARLNFAENLLRYRDQQPALISWNEGGRQRILSYSELFKEVAAVASALREYGVQSGDRVVGFIPNIPETIIAMLAAASIGAIWSSCSPEFGVKGVLDRFAQIQPKVLFAADGYIYAGRQFSCLERIEKIVQQIPEIEKVIIVPYQRSNPEISVRDKVVLYPTLIGRKDEDLVFAQLPFDFPLYIMYSSGTTGLPKCMVHGAGGTLIQHLKELVLHTDLKRQDRIFYHTTCGWMMWNWLTSSLAAGAAIVLYDGSPVYPSPGILFEMAEQEGMTVFGTSAKYLATIEKEGVEPASTHNLSNLKTILSTGSPLAPASFDYVYRKIKSDVCLSSISGGTDLISCFALGNPIGPVYKGELQVRGLGMKVQVYDEEGHSVLGQTGELVCTMAFPSMPVSFWNDPDRERYRKAYFDKYPGVWCHGDWVELTEQGGLIIYGRSDATLNPGGVRIGTAEIYRQVEEIDEILESLVVGQQWDGDVRIVLFVRLRPGLILDDSLKREIRHQIRLNASPHHIPRKIIQVDDLPRTTSGKITEIAVRKVIHGEPVKNLDALANPEIIERFRNIPELQC